jgi:hypothetical protein
VGRYPPQPVSVLEPSTTLLPIGSGYFQAKPFPTFSNLVVRHTYPTKKMEQTESSETSAYKIQTLGNYPEESIQHSEHDESLKSRILPLACVLNYNLFTFTKG